MNTLFIGLFDSSEPQRSLRDALRFASSEYAEFAHHKTDVNTEVMRSLTFKPDLVFMQLQRANVISPDLLSKLKKTGAFIVQWSGDVRKPMPSHYIKLGRQIDLSLFTNLEDVATMRKAGCKADYLQVSADHNIYKPEGKKVVCPSIVFMGNNYNKMFPLSDYRFRMVHFLKKTYGNEFGVYGSNWGGLESDNLMGRQEEEAEILRSCKIAINVSHFDLSNYTSDRFFRILLSSSLCLTKYFPGVETFQGESNRFVVFRDDFSNLKREIDRYLANENERKIIANNGYQYAFNECQWSHRIQELIKLKEQYGSAILA